MGQPSEKAKTPEQHKAVRALGLAIWADKKRLFSQAWVGDAAVRIRLFLICTYLFAIAWRHPPIAAKTQKAAALISQSHRSRRDNTAACTTAFFSFAVVRQLQNILIWIVNFVYTLTIHWAIGLIIDTGSSLAERTSSLL